MKVVIRGGSPKGSAIRKLAPDITNQVLELDKRCEYWLNLSKKGRKTSEVSETIL